ncbi:MAG: hypothetical protein GX155_08610 [Smithella sp.]|jgi:hypothetical protein|nr:hypothetical protein [Smithella sp.]
MLCDTVKKGVECGFMSKKGCSYSGGTCHPVIDRCDDCNKISQFETGMYCKVYPEPQVKWITGNCPSASHIKIEIKEAQKINPMKVSKRGGKK